MRRAEATAFDRHPGVEFDGEVREGLFGARDGIVQFSLVDPAHHLTQWIRLRDDLMGSEGLEP